MSGRVLRYLISGFEDLERFDAADEAASLWKSKWLPLHRERKDRKQTRERAKGAGAVTSRTLSTFLLRFPPLFSLRLAAIFPDLPIIVMSS